MSPEVGEVERGIAVPAAALTTRGGMHVKDGVDPLFRAERYDAVEVGEAVEAQCAWSGVGFEVAVIEGDADAVERKRFEEFGIGGSKEVREKLKYV